jgi:chromosome partitioning protein
MISEPYDWTVVDGAPQLQEMAASCISASDIILIPVQPSPYDIWACSDLVDTIKARQALTDNGQPKAFFVVSRMIQGTSLAADIVETLKDYELDSLKNMTVQRQIYAKSAVSGLSVMDAEPGGKAEDEIMAIVKELKSIEL